MRYRNYVKIVIVVIIATSSSKRGNYVKLVIVVIIATSSSKRGNYVRIVIVVVIVVVTSIYITIWHCKKILYQMDVTPASMHYNAFTHI